MAISLIDALAITEDTRQPFQIKFVSFNRDKRTGGKVIELPNAHRMGAKFKLSSKDMIAVSQDHGHPYPVHIHLITEINNQPIYI